MVRPSTGMEPVNGNSRKSRYSVPNLERALEILECLTEHPEGLSQSELAVRLKCSKTSVFRITATLLEWGYLEHREDQRSLRLSRKLLAMGTRALYEKDVVGSAIDVMRGLRDRLRETVLIGTLACGEFTVLEQVLGSYPFKFSVEPGTRLRLHTSAPAKAFIAFLPETEQDSLVEQMEFVTFTPATITSADRFREELDGIRERGYAVDRGEELLGVHCVGVPVFGRHGYPIAAIWTTGPAGRMGETALAGVGELMVNQVKSVSARLGYGLL